jgi:serine/threonine protein phosphatase PrpC
MLSEVMENATCAANSAVLKIVPDGGTTLTGALVLGEQVILSHVGDSRAYIITGEGIEQVTRDHSLVQRLKELGQITADEAATHPQRSVLYKAVGQSEGLEVDVISRRLPPGAILLVCSDGLWSLVADSLIYELVRKTTSLQMAGEALVAAANAAGRMRLESSLVALARCLRRGRVELSRAAASALAALPPRGWETLSELSDYADSITASAALEALERARKAPDGA